MNLTIAEVLLATISTPPLFASTFISKDSGTFEYVGSELTVSNPVQEVITSAYEAFGSERLVACLASLGCGYPGAISVPENSQLADWSRFLESLVTNNEQVAERVDNQPGHLGLYYRFSVTNGLEGAASKTGADPGEILTFTAAYLGAASLTRKLDRCVDMLKMCEGISTLEQLSKFQGYPLDVLHSLTAEHSGGKLRYGPPFLPSREHL